LVFYYEGNVIFAFFAEFCLSMYIVGGVGGHGDLDGLFARLSIAPALPTIFLPETEQQALLRSSTGRSMGGWNQDATVIGKEIGVSGWQRHTKKRRVQHFSISKAS
jgi:hypothetical protein